MKSSKVKALETAKAKTAEAVMAARDARRNATIAKRAERMLGRLWEGIRRRKEACAGLPLALETEREAFANVGREYTLALSEFEADHCLEITW